MSRRVGSAVVRNRVKRRVREWFRGQQGKLQPGTDLVVIGRKPAAVLDGREVAAALCRLARNAGVLR